MAEMKVKIDLRNLNVVKKGFEEAQIALDRQLLLREGAEKQAEQFLQRALKAEAFKEYVHKRLDEAGVPHDPDPEYNSKHGCRIEGRLTWLFRRLARWVLAKELLKEMEYGMPDKTCPMCGVHRPPSRHGNHSESCRLGHIIYGANP